MGHIHECRRSWRPAWFACGAFLIAACSPLTTPPSPDAPMATQAPLPATRLPATAAPVASLTAPAPTTAATVTPNTDCAQPLAISASPKAGWLAVDCHDTAARFTVSNSSLTWTIGGEALSQRESLERQALMWSLDDRFLYFTETAWRAEHDREAYAEIGSIHRLTLATGDLVTLLISVNDVPAYSAAIDRDGAHLAWLQADAPRRVTIMDLHTFATRKLDLAPELATAGDLTWDPEGGRVLLSAVSRTGAGALVMIEPATSTAVMLPTPDDRVMRITAWEPDGPVQLHDTAWPDPGVWTLNLTTGDFMRQGPVEGP
jgi:hypothetical protein